MGLCGPLELICFMCCRWLPYLFLLHYFNLYFFVFFPENKSPIYSKWWHQGFAMNRLVPLPYRDAPGTDLVSAQITGHKWCSFSQIWDQTLVFTSSVVCLCMLLNMVLCVVCFLQRRLVFWTFSSFGDQCFTALLIIPVSDSPCDHTALWNRALSWAPVGPRWKGTTEQAFNRRGRWDSFVWEWRYSTSKSTVKR